MTPSHDHRPSGQVFFHTVTKKRAIPNDGCGLHSHTLKILDENGSIAALTEVVRTLEARVAVLEAGEPRPVEKVQESVGVGSLPSQQSIESSGVEFSAVSVESSRVGEASSPPEGEYSFCRLREIPTEYKFQESVWDVSVWIGLFNLRDSALTAGIVFLNIFVQVYFCILIHNNLSDISLMSLSDYDLESFLNWRIVTQHVVHYDHVFNTSHAAEACGPWGGGGTTSSHHQINLYEDFRDYLGDGEFVDMVFGGAGLCCLALGCWFCLVASDMLDNFEFSCALIKCSTSHTVITPPSNIRHLNRKRVALILLLTSVPRFFIALLLFYSGARFLVFTADLQDVILNAVALGFVLDVDGLLFTFIPPRLRRAIQNMEPLPLGRVCRLFHVSDFRPLFVSVVGVGIATFGYFLVGDVVNRMSVAQDLLCGGTLDFVYVLDAATGVTYIGSTDTPSELDVTSYKIRSVLAASDLHRGILSELSSIISLGDWSAEDNSSITTTVDDVRAREDYSTTTALNSLMCQDTLDSSDPALAPFLQRAREASGIHWLSQCSELSDQCSTSLARMFCPLTCSCHTMYTGMYDRTGCSTLCDTFVLSEVEVVSQAVGSVGTNSSKCIAQGDNWMSTFLDELQAALVGDGILEEVGDGYAWTATFKQLFAERMFFEYTLRDVDVKLDTWLNTEVGQGVCDAVSYLDNLFSTDLCSTSNLQSVSRNSLEGLCPNACGLCSPDAFSGTALGNMDLSALQSTSVSEGLFAFELFEQNTSAVVLSCKSYITGTTTTGTSDLGDPASPDRSYTFESASDTTATFSTCGTSSFDSTIGIYDKDWTELVYNDDSDACDGSSSALQVSVSGGKTYNVLLEGAEATSGYFILHVWC